MKKAVSKLLAIIMITCLSLQLLNLSAQAAGTNDYQGNWAQSSIETLLSNSIISGDETGSIHPNNNMTRAEFVTLINKAFGYTVKTDSNFPDVESGLWYTDAFSIAKHAGYIKGDSNGNANPNNNITREEVCVILARVLSLETGTDTKLTFLDESQINNWAYSGVKALYDLLLIVGNPDKTFRPHNPITRAECFTIFAKIVDKGLNEVEKPTASVASGTYNSNQTVELTSKTTGAAIYYTIDGTTPTISSTKYAAAINVNKQMTVKAIAVRNNLLISDVAVFDYVISSASTIGGGGGIPINPPATSITREQWIVALVNKLGLTITSDALTRDANGNPIYTYADISGSANILAIEAAVVYSALKVDSSETTHYFKPNDICTREFAAVTTVNALGFIDTNGTLECPDASELAYPSQDAIAVSVELISLLNGRFMPNAGLTSAEEAVILDKAFLIFAPPDMSGGNDTYTPAEGLVQLIADEVDGYSVSVNGDIYTVIVPKNDTTSSLTSNSVFALPASSSYPDGLAMKVNSVTDNEDGTLTLLCSIPDISEVYSSMDVQGTADSDFNNFIPADGVTIVDYSEPEILQGNNDSQETILDISSTDTQSINSQMAIDSNESLLAAEDTSDAPKITFTIKPDGSAEASLKLPVEDSPGVYAFAKINIVQPQLYYNVDIDWMHVKIRDLYFAIHTKAAVDGGISWEGEHTTKKSWDIPVGELPVYVSGVKVAAVKLVFHIESSGEVHIKFQIDNTFGVQIVNNQPRLVFALTPTVSVEALSAQIAAGPQLIALLELKVPLIREPVKFADVDFFAGVGFKGSLTVRDTGMVCLDGRVFVPATLSAGSNEAENTLLYQILENNNIECNWNIWDDDTSIFMSNKHAENNIVVNTCTFVEETGQITGVVLKASDRNTPIQNASIAVYNENGTLIESLLTGDNGSYVCTLGKGDYKIVISATGYMTFTSTVTVETGHDTYVESLLLIDETGDPDATGVAGGNITDSITGSAVTNVSVTVRSNWNNDTGTVVYNYTTGNEGVYTLTLPLGNYTVQFTKDGYVTNYKNIIVKPTDTLDQHVTLNPLSPPSINGTLRMVLTWGSTPSDLDSHLFGPTADGTDRFHTYYSDKDYTEDTTTVANLDLDDTSSYGPETTTVYNLNTSGIYSFFVHDFSNRDLISSSALSRSGAQVKVYSGDTLIAIYNVPTNTNGTLWHVFDYNASTQSITVSNAMSYTAAPTDRSISAMTIVPDSGKTDQEIIAHNITEKTDR